MARHVARVAGPRDGKRDGARLSPVRTVLVVARDPATCGEIVGALQRRGFPAMQGTTAPQALYWARRQPPALVILDARLPGWLHLIREFRQKGRTVLTLVDSPEARTKSLEAGCLDVELSDFDADELARRVETLLRRGWASEVENVGDGPLRVDLSTATLVWRGRPVAASQILLRLAAFLASNPGRVVPTKVLLEEVWSEPWADPNKVHQAVWRLRRLLGEPGNSRFLVGRQRHGYAFMPEGAAIRSGPSRSQRVGNRQITDTAPTPPDQERPDTESRGPYTESA